MEIISSNHVSIEEVEKDEKVPHLEDAQKAPASFKKGNQGTIDELKQVNLSTEQDLHPIFISVCLTLKEENSYLDLLNKYRDVFAWNYKEMPGLDPKVVVHHLAVRKNVRSIKQAQRRFHPDLIP